MEHRAVSDIEHTAYHEAGHAVAACSVRRAFKSVSIVEDDDSLGRVLYSPFTGEFLESVSHGSLGQLAVRSRVEKVIITAYGGAAAAELLTGEVDNDGPQQDMARAADFLTRMTSGPEEAQAYGNWLWYRTKAILASPQRWPAVEAVARALLERHTLSYHAVRKIARVALQDAFQRHLNQVRPSG